MKKLLTTLLLLLLASPAGAVVDPVGWWKFDAGAGSTAVDSGSGTTDCTLINTPSWVAGHIGAGALSFDSASSEYADCTTDPAIDITGDFTFSAWVNPSTLPTTDSTYFTILSKGYSSISDTEQYVLRFTYGGPGGGSARLQCLAYELGNNHFASYEYGGAITTGNWYHIACTFDGSTYKLYVDNVEVASNTDSTGPVANDQKLLIGAEAINGVPSRFFDGTIDDVRIYNRAITMIERSEMFNQTEGGGPAAPNLFGRRR